MNKKLAMAIILIVLGVACLIVLHDQSFGTIGGVLFILAGIISLFNIIMKWT